MSKLYFFKRNLGVQQGAQVHVRYSYGTLFQGGVDKQLKAGVREGITALNYTFNYMSTANRKKLNDNFQNYFEKYFLTEDCADDATFKAVYTVLQLTKTGLANTTIKVFSSAENDPEKSVQGYVKYNFGGATHKHHNLGEAYDHKTGTKRPAYKGDIHMSLNYVGHNKSLNNAVLFIHEATHKYAGTADFGEKGYTSDSGGYGYLKAGLTTAQALMNADSYGRFVLHFYRAEHNIQQW